MSDVKQTNLFVIAGLDPAIHRLAKKLDARVKPGHDESEAKAAEGIGNA